MPELTPPSRALHLPLYVRIWLAVVLAVALLTLLAGWVARISADPPLARSGAAQRSRGSGGSRSPSFAPARKGGE